MTDSPGERALRERRLARSIAGRCEVCQNYTPRNKRFGNHRGPGSHVPVDAETGEVIRFELVVTDHDEGLQERFA